MDKRLFVFPAVGAGLVLLVPLVMTVLDRHKPVGDGWHWSPLDFLIMGTLIFCAGVCYQVLARKLQTKTRRLVLALVMIAVVLAIWVELAVDGISQWLSYLFG